MTQEPTAPEPTVVVAPMRRSYTSAMFDDLLPEGAFVASRVVGKPAWTVTFIGTEPGPALDAETVAAVVARMESTDDADQAKRADLRAKRDAVIGDEPEKVAVRAAIDYMLGD